MKTPIPKTAQEVHETLYDGADLTVKLKDGSERTVKVRKIPRKEYAAFARSLGSEELQAGHYLGGTGLVEKLTDESFDQVMQEGHRLNFTSFANFFRRQADLLTLANGNEAVTQAMLTVIQASPDLRKLLSST